MTFAADQDHGKRPSTGVIAAIVGVAMLLATFMVVFAVRSTGGTDRPAAAPAPTTAGPKTTAQVTRESLTWVEVEGFRLPISASEGPTQRDGDRASGFAHTPAGAVLAAVHIGYRSSPALGPAVYRPTIREQVVGVDKDRFLTKVEQDYKTDQVGGVTPSGAVAASIAKAKATRSGAWAYRVDSFDPASASVQLLSRAFATAGAPAIFVNFAWTLKWVDGDWRLVAPLNGDFQNTARVFSEVPGGYTTFGEEG